jgi:hypothetical protein
VVLIGDTQYCVELAQTHAHKLHTLLTAIIAKTRFRFPAVVTVFIDPVTRKCHTLTELVYKDHADNQRQLLTVNPAVMTIEGVILLRRCNRSL